jgi:hypothetical protein
MDLAPSTQLLSLVNIWLAYVASAEPGMPFVIATLLSAKPGKWLDLSPVLTALYRIQHTITRFVHVWQPHGATAGGLRSALAALVYMGVLELGANPLNQKQNTKNPQTINTSRVAANQDLVGLLLNQPRLEPGVLSVRLTATGRQALLHNTVDTDFPFSNEPESQPFIVQPNYEVMVRPFTPPGKHWHLAAISDLVRPDQAYIYRVNKDTVIRALRAGWTEDALIDFLHTGGTETAPAQGKSGALLPVPQNVEYSIRTWSSGFGRCTVMRLAVVQCESEELADRLIAEGSLRDLLIGRVSPTALLVRDDALKKVITSLEKAGLPPPAEPVYVTDTETAERYGMPLPEQETLTWRK